MPYDIDPVLFVAASVVLMVLNAACIFLVALQLPGTWIMLAATGTLAWWRWEHQTIGWWMLAALLIVALLGELLELLGGSIGAAKAGSTWLGTVGALMGGILGAIVGTFVLPIPIIGTVVGACVGAAVGSVAGNARSEMAWETKLEVARGAAWGKFWGTLAKIGVAIIMWLMILAALIF